MYQQKYLKYKTKYINLKNEIMGGKGGNRNTSSSLAGNRKIKEAEAGRDEAIKQRDEANKRTEREVSALHKQLTENVASYDGRLADLSEKLAASVSRSNELDEQLERSNNFKQKARKAFQKMTKEKDALEKETQELKEALKTSSSQENIKKEADDVVFVLEELIQVQNSENIEKEQLIAEMSTQVSSLGQNNTDLEQKVLELEGIINEKDRRRAKLLDAVGRLTNYLANNAQPKKVNSFW